MHCATDRVPGSDRLVGGPGEAFSPLSLATLGFILLAAYTLGEIAGRVGLPRITGYIATGGADGGRYTDRCKVWTSDGELYILSAQRNTFTVQEP